MMKHSWRTVILFTVLAFSLASFACTKKPVKPDEPVGIQFWTRQTQSDRQEKIQLLIDVFETLNPDVKVTMLPVEENEFPAQLAAAGEANRPDLIEIQGYYAMSFYEEGLVNSSANAELIKMIGENEFYPGSLDNVKMGDGSYFGIPFHFAAQGFWYRKDWFQEAGLAPPTSWEAIMEAAKYFNDPANKQYGILIGTKPEGYTQQVFTHLATANGAHIFDSNGNLTIGSPEFRESLEYYRELSQYTPPGPQTWRARDYYLQGKMAMFYYSTYIMDDLSIAEVAQSSLTPENFPGELEGAEFDATLVENTGFVSLISNEKTTGYGEVMALSLLKSNDEKRVAAAKRLAAFFMTDENYIPYLHIQPGGLLPVKNSALKSENFLDDPNGVYSRYGEAKIMEIVSGLGNIEDFLKKDGVVFPDSATILAKNILARMLYNITIENKDIDAEIEVAEKEIKRLLEQ